MALVGWFVGSSIAGFVTVYLVERSYYRDKMRRQAMQEKTLQAAENAKMAEAVREAMESAGQIILHHVDYIDPDDYFSEAVLHAVGRQAGFELRRITDSEEEARVPR